MEKFLKALFSARGTLAGVITSFEKAFLEQCLNCVESDANSPTRGDEVFFSRVEEVLKKVDVKSIRFDIEKFKSFSEEVFAIFNKIREGVGESFTSIRENEGLTKTVADEGFWRELREFAQETGVLMGYTKVPRTLIFKGKKILFPNAIVLAMEMRKSEIDKAPEQEAGIETMRVYAELGEAANKIASFLREQGCKAQASHPLGGLVLYPPLAARAGLGYPGRHGLLITPQFGPRQRLAAVFTDIENMPYTESNEHTWIRDFCYECGLCVRECPGGAILEKPIMRENGLQTSIDKMKCFPYFATNLGCSVCIRVCPFNRIEYEKIKETFLKKREKIPDLISQS
ncbi:MAG: 4Fe-4S dicluster domain-containing protein [Candidatus Freyarchaeota archaeon]